MKAKLTKVGRAAMKVVASLAMISLTIAVGYYALAAVAWYVSLGPVADWTAKDKVGATVIALFAGFVVLSSVLAFLAAVVEGRKLSRPK